MRRSGSDITAPDAEPAADVATAKRHSSHFSLRPHRHRKSSDTAPDDVSNVQPDSASTIYDSSPAASNSRLDAIDPKKSKPSSLFNINFVPTTTHPMPGSQDHQSDQPRVSVDSAWRSLDAAHVDDEDPRSGHPPGLDLDAYGSPIASARSSASDKKRTFSALPRIRNALSHAHLPTLSRPPSYDSTQSSPRHNSQTRLRTGSEDALFALDPSSNSGSRRPSYASINTRSSTGSRVSRHRSEDDPDAVPPGLVLAGSPYSSAKADCYPTNGPISFPDPEQVFNAKQYADQAGALSKYTDIGSSHSKQSSRSGSIASTSSDTRQAPVKRRTFLGKLISRRESNDQTVEKKRRNKSDQAIKTRYSTSSLSKESTSKSRPRESSRGFLHSRGSQASISPTSGPLQRNREMSGTSLSNLVLDADEHKPVIQLDTNLEKMSGIVKDRDPLAAADDAIMWKAPESWGIHHEMPLTEDALWSPSSTSPQTDKKRIYFLRVFRDENTFGTVACPLYATVAEVLQILGRKFFLPSVSGFQLSLQTAGLTRVLRQNERPVLLQKILLEFMGYTEKDRLPDLGRDDLRYLCRFELSESPIKSQQTLDQRLVVNDYAHVYLRNASLQTIPIPFFQRASEIESLDVSENPSLSIPLDFIQACVKLREVRYINNRCLQFPSNIGKIANLTHLDLSGNLLVTLDNVKFTALSRLVNLNVQGNRLDELPDSMSELKSLKVLNLASNNVRTFPSALCEIKTLTDVDFSFNRIEVLPDEIGNLTSLERLGMTNNVLSKALPKTFEKLVSLVELDIRYNKLQNIDILASLPKLSLLYSSKNSVSLFEKSFQNISMFFFDRNPITRIRFSEPLLGLTVLNLSKAKLTVLGEQFVLKIPNVEKLILDRNHLATLPPAIGTLKRLQHLSIVGNQLKDIPPDIGQLRELRTLDLHCNNLKTLPAEVWNLSALTVLNISTNLIEAFPKPNAHVGSVSSADSVQEFKPIAVPSEIEAYELKDDFDRRPSVMSVASTVPSPKDVSGRRGSLYPPLQAISAQDGSFSGESRIPRGRQLSQSLTVLRAADNRFGDECFQEISLLHELQVLNLSYNDLMDIPFSALSRLTHLRELYLSGNNLTSLPSDDFENISDLRVFHVNSNKLHSLPAEIGKVAHLQVFDVGSNQLKYNINNWPYDWNWNFNLDLRYLNFSGNRRLEIKNTHVAGMRGADDTSRNLSDFTVLRGLQVLGMMDVTLTTPSVPDQTENCRVRTYGSEVLSMRYGMADFLGANESLSAMDLVIERFQGHEKEAVIGLFDGRNDRRYGGNKISKMIQESFGTLFGDELKNLHDDETVSDALRRAFLATNREIGNVKVRPDEEISRPHLWHQSSTAQNMTPEDRCTGSCATIIYFVDTKMYVANVGNTMAVLSKRSGEYSVLTRRHDPTSKEELERIREGAGMVSSNGKLDGVLDVSRAIGCYNLIPHIHADPSISEWDLTDADDFLILASSQLWEFLSYEDAIDTARIDMSKDPMMAAQRLRDLAIAYGCNEKIMVMVVNVGSFNRNKKFKSGGMSHLGALHGVEEELFPSLLKKRRDKSLLPEDSSLARLGGEVDPPVGDVAMVFTDIKNSTLLWENNPGAMQSAIKIHNALMRRNIRIIGGYEVKTEGDAFIVSFPTPTSALLWCFSIQSQLLEADWPEEILESAEGQPVTDVNGNTVFRGLSVRMGIHWGRPVSEIDVITKRMDYFGPMVNRTARISAVADGGQITLSSDFWSEIRRLTEAHQRVSEGSASLGEAYGDEVVGQSLDHDMRVLGSLGYMVRDLGEMKLKGLENPEQITVIYPTPLQGRLHYHEENPTPEQVSQRALPAGVGLIKQFELKPEKRPSHPLGASAMRTGGLTIDLLMQLRTLSNRVEKICSQMNMGMPDMVSSFYDYNRKTSANVGAVIPNTDYDFVMFFEQIITRLENALSTLCIRTAAHHLVDEDSTTARMALAELLDVVLKLRPSNFRLPKPGHEKDKEPAPMS